MYRRPTGRPGGRPVKAIPLPTGIVPSGPPVLPAALSFDIRPRSSLRRLAASGRPTVLIATSIPRSLHDEVRTVCLERRETLAYFVARALTERVRALRREED